MLTENIRKHLKKLTQKKYRREFGEFVIEGIKGVEEAMNSGLKIKMVILEEDKRSEIIMPLFVDAGPEVLYANKNDIKEIKTTETFPGILAVVTMPQITLQDFDFARPILCLDGVKDPGNLGTIIRTADWFGIKNILLSEDCVDPYNEKVVRSTMGSIFRAHILESDNILKDVIELKKENYDVVGLQMEGDNALQTEFSTKSIFVFGSESHGISQALQKFLDKSCTIPKIGEAESLNVGIAVGIVLSQLGASKP